MENKSRFPLMKNNISRRDLDGLIEYFKQEDPKLTHGPRVLEFERKWAEWVGTKYAVCVNSGSSANDLTMLALRHLKGEGEVIVPPLTWVSDIASVIHAGLKPRFVDIKLNTLAMNEDLIFDSVNADTRAVFLTHVLGLNGLTDRLVEHLKKNDITLVEDVCESHGALLGSRRLGSLGWASNFSFYYAHHLTTIEGGAICTSDERLYQFLRSARSHGLLREVSDEKMRLEISESNSTLNSEFIFQFAAHNMRPTEITGILGLSQMNKLEDNIRVRNENFNTFLQNIDASNFYTDFDLKGQSNYAFILILKDPCFEKRNRVEVHLKKNSVEFRRGLSGGGNQLRQPYLRSIISSVNLAEFPVIEHIHNFSWYLGNYPELSQGEIYELCQIVNSAS